MDIDLTKPAFGPGSQKIEEQAVETPATDSQPEVEKVEEPVTPAEPSVEEPAEETRVPYSRFQKFHSEAVQLREEVAQLRSQIETKEPEQSESELPSYWVKLYGDSEASQEAWKIQERANEELIQRTRQEAVEAVRSERYEEAQKIDQNVQTIDENLDNLSAMVGRDLTEKEQAAVLDIVDDYTPKDEDGNYAGQTIPFEKAWEIYELKTRASKAPQRQSRDAVAALTGSRTDGEPSVASEKDKNFNPLNWGDIGKGRV